ncbi:hypothetical protein V8E54_001535, partial [Elaphomyces granulatus]
TCISSQDRNNLGAIIMKGRVQYQALCVDASSSVATNPRSHVPTPRGPIVPSLAKDPNVEAEKKRALQYTNDSKKPNVHIGLHYELVKDEYGLPSHIHVLIGEEKHRWFKKIVYHTNHSNVERSLLNRENVQQTVRLLLAHACQHSDPELTSLFTELY